MKRIRKKIFVLSLLVVLCSPSGAWAQEYDLLPKLDGKVDSAVCDRKPVVDLKSENEVIEDQHSGSAPPPPDQKVATTEETKVSKAHKVPLGNPKLDTMDPPIKADVISDSIRFKKYQKDLKKMLALLVDLGGTIEEGATIQLFSAKANNIHLMNELFVEKYSGTAESKLESYRLVQKVARTAMYTRKFWFETNKFKTNQGGMPDEVLQTKLLQIVADVEQLLELQKINSSLQGE